MGKRFKKFVLLLPDYDLCQGGISGRDEQKRDELCLILGEDFHFDRNPLSWNICQIDSNSLLRHHHCEIGLHIFISCLQSHNYKTSQLYNTWLFDHFRYNFEPDRKRSSRADLKAMNHSLPFHQPRRCFTKMPIVASQICQSQSCQSFVASYICQFVASQRRQFVASHIPQFVASQRCKSLPRCSSQPQTSHNLLNSCSSASVFCH